MKERCFFFFFFNQGKMVLEMRERYGFVTCLEEEGWLLR
jgi:hypothetical protein